MKALTPIAFLLFVVALAPGAALAADAEGCVDLKLFPHLEGCAIVECSAKQHDSFDLGTTGPPLDVNTNSLVYSCPVGVLDRLKHDFDGQLLKAGYQNIVKDTVDSVSSRVSARKGPQLLQWVATAEENATSYTLTTATPSTDKLKPEACAQPAELSSLKQCEIVECNSKAEDSVAFRTAPNTNTGLTGNVHTVTMSCPATIAAQTLSAVDSQLKSSGFEILFTDPDHPEHEWITGRSGKRWVELISAPEGESVTYALTVVPSAEVLGASKAEPSVVAAATPAPEPTPKAQPAPKAEPAPVAVAQPPKPDPAPATEPVRRPEPVETAGVVAPPAPSDSPEPDAASSAAAAPPAPPRVQFIPPKPVLEVPIDATHDRIYSVTGDVVITLLVDVNEDGAVTSAVLGGRVTKDVLKLESAALEAIAHWRFEPARQDGRVVASVKTPVQMHFRGRPWRF